MFGVLPFITIFKSELWKNVTKKKNQQQQDAMRIRHSCYSEENRYVTWYWYMPITYLCWRCCCSMFSCQFDSRGDAADGRRPGTGDAADAAEVAMMVRVIDIASYSKYSNIFKYYNQTTPPKVVDQGQTNSWNRQKLRRLAKLSHEYWGFRNLEEYTWFMSGNSCQQMVGRLTNLYIYVCIHTYIHIHIHIYIEREADRHSNGHFG